MRDVEELARLAVDSGLMNVGGETFREGLKRVVNNHGPFAPSRLCVNRSSPIQATRIDE